MTDKQRPQLQIFTDEYGIFRAFNLSPGAYKIFLPTVKSLIKQFEYTGVELLTDLGTIEFPPKTAR